MRGRPVAFAAIAGGLAVAAIAQLSAPGLRPPLYDGVAVTDPYRYLAPAAGQPGNPGSAQDSVPISGGQSQALRSATTEQPPQAQIVAPAGAFGLPPGTTSVNVTIEPVPAPAPPTNGRVLGNVYRIAVENQAGVALTANAGANVSVLLRSPGSIATAQIERWNGSAWEGLGTVQEATGIWLALATEFGEFALVGSGPLGTLGPVAAPSVPQEIGGASGSSETDLLVPIGATILVVVLLVGALVALSRRSA